MPSQGEATQNFPEVGGNSHKATTDFFNVSVLAQGKMISKGGF